MKVARLHALLRGMDQEVVSPSNNYSEISGLPGGDDLDANTSENEQAWGFLSIESLMQEYETLGAEGEKMKQFGRKSVRQGIGWELDLSKHASLEGSHCTFMKNSSLTRHRSLIMRSSSCFRSIARPSMSRGILRV